MTVGEIIHTFRESGDKAPDDTLRSYYQFKPGMDENGKGTDANLEFRTELTEALLYNFSISDIALIRDLFDTELECEHAIWRHDNLYRLSYYLYELGQYEDVFRLYEAKYGTGHMDASLMQDLEMLHFGKPTSQIIAYVMQRFENDANLKKQYPDLLEKLHELKEDPDYDNPQTYTEYIRGYHCKRGKQKSDEREVQKPKPWWKFW